MELNQLPDLSDWRYIEVWTIEEAAMLWAAIDPSNHIDCRIDSLKRVLPDTQYRKAWIYQRAISEGVCSGSLEFIEAWERSGNPGNEWNEKLNYPQLPSLNSLIHSATRVKQSVFLKWVSGKKIPSYRQEIMNANRNTPEQTAPVEVVINKPIAEPPLVLLGPDFRDIDHPNHAIELKAGVDVWEAINGAEATGKSQTPKNRALQLLATDPKFKEFSKDARGRIATSVNWNKKGGPPKTPGG